MVDQNLGASATASPLATATPAIPAVSQERLISPTLRGLALSRVPTPLPICAWDGETGCAKAQWFTTRKAVKCYCHILKMLVWSTDEPDALTSCDGFMPWMSEEEIDEEATSPAQIAAPALEMKDETARILE